jgi:hypothetical protein
LAGKDPEKYERAAYRAKHGFWADFIHPTATAESTRLFHALNTYDRAHFTFTFLQFAAHEPNEDFVRYFRALLTLPAAADYFPDLVLENNRVCRKTDHGAVPLETDASTQLLQDYLNPSSKEVEDTEVIQSAKFVHWVQNDPAHRDMQVEVGVTHFRNKMASYAKTYNLDNVGDTVCLLVADIRHQGRAKNPEIIAALRSASPVESLLAIGEGPYTPRIQTLRAEIKKLTDEGTLGKHKYSSAARDFIAA